MQAKGIRDRQSIADHVAGYMQNVCPSFSIDTLLTRPLDAIEMAVTVAHAAGRISGASAGRLRRAIRQIVEQDGAAVEAIYEVCRAALASRKRGDLRRDRY